MFSGISTKLQASAGDCCHRSARRQRPPERKNCISLVCHLPQCLREGVGSVRPPNLRERTHTFSIWEMTLYLGCHLPWRDAGYMTRRPPSIAGGMQGDAQQISRTPIATMSEARTSQPLVALGKSWGMRLLDGTGHSSGSVSEDQIGS